MEILTAESRTDLLVGHTTDVLIRDNTIESLYIKPLLDLLARQNEKPPVSQDTPNGIFTSNPTVPVVLMIDIKDKESITFKTVQATIEPLRSKGYLRYFNGKKIVPGPVVVVVVSGMAQFDLVVANDTYRDIFFDAPLPKLNEKGKCR